MSHCCLSDDTPLHATFSPRFSLCDCLMPMFSSTFRFASRMISAFSAAAASFRHQIMAPYYFQDFTSRFIRDLFRCFPRFASFAMMPDCRRHDAALRIYFILPRRCTATLRRDVDFRMPPFRGDAVPR